MAFLSCLSCFQKAEEEEVTELDYAHQSLNDVPNEVFAFERTLESITLDCNNIRDLPRQLFHCEGLKSLSVADNDVHVIPPAIASLTNLAHLNVSKNVLTDIPDTIKQCKLLAVLDASVNPLQKIPEGCTQLLSITELYLNDTFLEFLPANFGRLSKLKILELRENGLTTLPKSLNRLVNLERLDLGQNEMSEVPEVIGALVALKELWLDGNKIRGLSDMVGNLKNLVHLEASMNRIDYISEAIDRCKLLTDLALSTNDLKSLPEAIGGLDALVTLKLDDNQLGELPMSIGRLKNLEELVISQNYLESLPPSIGLCRKLHTLNLDDNDIEVLPKELGSCKSLRILSAHGNRLTTLPAEIDHLTNLAVMNLTANMIQHLPVSLMKLGNITAIWLSENQHKPLVQLVQDTDPETGQKVLINFLLPQQNQDDLHTDNKSETGSFHALAWEEERSRRSQVKWAGDYQHSESVPLAGSSSLRREPTPFPKEMRAMAKRVQNLRNKKISEVPADDLMQKKKRRASLEISCEAASNKDLSSADEQQRHHTGELSVSDTPSLEVREAKVFSLPSPTSEDKELKSFEELEKSVMVSSDPEPIPANSPDKTSRDSGVSDGSTPDQLFEQPQISTRNPSDPLPQAPVKAEVVTNVLEPGDQVDKKPPPYHIAAQMSRHAGDFSQNQTLERKSSFMSEASMSSETSTAPSSLQTIVRAPPNNDQNNSETESVYNHAHNLRKVSEQLLLGNKGRVGSAIPRPSPLGFSNIAGSEARPSSYAGPQNTVGLPVMSPASSNRLNTTLPIPSSANSTLERKPSSGIKPPTPLSSLIKSPPPAIPTLNLRPKNNGLLTTIEQAALSDEEPSSPTTKMSLDNSSSRIPTPLTMIQPNYENVANAKISQDSQGLTVGRNNSNIPVIAKKTSIGDRLSTANFVATSSPNNMTKRAILSPTRIPTPK